MAGVRRLEGLGNGVAALAGGRRGSSTAGAPLVGSRQKGADAPVAEAGCGCAEPRMDAGGRRLEGLRHGVAALAGCRCGWLRGACATITCPPPVVFAGREHAPPSPVFATKGELEQDWTSLGKQARLVDGWGSAGGVEAEGSRCSGGQRRVAAARSLEWTPEGGGSRGSDTASLHSRDAGAAGCGEHAPPSPVRRQSCSPTTRGELEQDWTSLL